MKNSNKNLAGGDLWFSGSYRGQWIREFRRSGFEQESFIRIHS
jgi:hypothetical protein